MAATNIARLREGERSENLRFMLNGRQVERATAEAAFVGWAKRDLWDMSDLWPIWNRLVDEQEDSQERVECAEIISRITHDELEFFVPEG